MRMLLKTLLCSCLVAVSLLAAANSDSTAAANDPLRPNMVVFLSDDHTWRDSSVYGSTDIQTPNMARLAEAGMTFGQAFVASPTCAPSRAAMLTGMYPARNGAEPNHSRPAADLKKLPAYLQELGYEVVSFGKVGHYRQTTDYGFDLARHFGYHEDIAVPNAIKWLRERVSDRPLCLFVGSNWPHVPWPEDIGDLDSAMIPIPPNHVSHPVTQQWRARYIAAINKMDGELGQVYDVAREKLGPETFFLHTSDHGAQWPFGKWTLYEDGIRTPMIVSWPGRVAAGERTTAMVSWIDILPTLLDVAGAESPKGIDGRSFLPVMEQKSEVHRKIIFTTHSGDGNNNVFPIRSARTADGWKYIRNLQPQFRNTSHVTSAPSDSGYWDSWIDQAVASPEDRKKVRRYLERPAEELYNVHDDPWEQNNLAAEPAVSDRLAELRRSVDQWMAETGDPQLVYGRPKRQAGPDRPNIITVLIDDMGWSDLSCYGGESVQTEHLDRLAAEGIRFTQFYVNSPICSPSRVALTTGHYPQRWRITSYLAHRALNDERGMAQWLDPQAPVLARELNHAGYATGHFGKWHMGGQRDVGDAPLIHAYGFDRSLTNFEGLGPRVLPLKDSYDGQPPQGHDLGSANLGHGPIIWKDRSTITADFVDEAIRFIDRAEATDQPFYINLWPDDVHSPFFPPKVLRDETDGSKRELYNAVLKAMDQQLGTLIDRIRNDDKLRNNTLIVVASDNGHEPDAGNSDPLRASKGWLYEGGVRSPLIVWGPGIIAQDAAGSVNDESIFSAIDVNASLYNIAGVDPPESAKLDGEDLASTLLGKEAGSRSSPICWRRPPDRPGSAESANPDLAVRDGRWKFYVAFDGSSPELYDLQKDVSETTNLAAQQPEVVQRLKQFVLYWNAQLPADAGDSKSFRSAAESAVDATASANEFVNPIGEGADPWVIRDPHADRYLWCFSEGNRAIAVHTSDSLTSLGQKHIVWTAPEAGPVSREVWAPELHFLDDRWHIYFAASDGRNENHLAYVLRSEGADPLGSYELHGPLATGEGADGRSPSIWAIDMTVLEHAGKRYALWSGWDAPGTDQQFLYIAPMKSAYELAGPRVRICANDDYPWERTEPGPRGRGLNEAPQVLKSRGAAADRERTFVTYSCGASWLPTYKLGLLELVGEDPLDPRSWTKRRRPWFAGTDETFGVGHSCFIMSADETQWWHVFHAKRDRNPGWRRTIFVQPMSFGPQGVPHLGTPVAPGKVLPRPSGDVVKQVELPLTMAFTEKTDLRNWNYYGHHQFFDLTDTGLSLGRVPDAPVNEFRSGEKVVLNAVMSADFSAEVTIDFLGSEQARDAGILFRTSGPSIGYDAQQGYFVGIIPASQLIIFGVTNGKTWTEIARAPVQLNPALPQRLAVTSVGERITVSLAEEPVFTTTEGTYGEGTVGLRVVNTHAKFSDLQIAPVRDKKPVKRKR
jgi:arylsulfatase A-like enzyme/GH43 family beta-xylosidase